MLGGNIALSLKNEYNIFGADLEKINIPGIHSEIINLLDIHSLIVSIKNIKPDILIHTAAAVNVEACEEDFNYAHQLNSELTKQISLICKEYKIKMIYISTDAVFDGNRMGLYTELDQVNPINNYGLTKLDGEYETLKVNTNIVLRTNIYGYNIQGKNSFGEWILYSLLENKEISMFDDIFFSPILANELAGIIGKIIDKDLNGLYHVSGAGSISKYNFGMELKKIFHIEQGIINKSKSSDFHFKAKRALNMGMNNMKICEALGIQISTPIESIQMFKKYYDEGLPQLLKTMR